MGRFGALRGARGARDGVRHLHSADEIRATLLSVGRNTLVGVPDYRGASRLAPSDERRGLGALRHGLRSRGTGFLQGVRQLLAVRAPRLTSWREGNAVAEPIAFSEGNAVAEPMGGGP